MKEKVSIFKKEFDPFNVHNEDTLTHFNGILGSPLTQPNSWPLMNVSALASMRQRRETHSPPLFCTVATSHFIIFIRVGKTAKYCRMLNN